MTKKINIHGFAIGADGRAWNADASLGLIAEDDGTLRLLDAEGAPAANALAADQAEHVLSRARQAGDEPYQAMIRWDNYASTL